MFVEIQVSSSALFTSLVGWNALAVCLHPVDVIFVQLGHPTNDVIFHLHWEQLTYPYKYWVHWPTFHLEINFVCISKMASCRNVMAPKRCCFVQSNTNKKIWIT
jgi:hypothetical protein